jgi:triacylglycerol esterase/lipase EstA (alpha/beta hydrolase family)
MRGYGPAVILAALVAIAASPAAAPAARFAAVDTPGPALDVPAAQLAKSMQCSPGVDHATRAPVLLVPGTGATATQEFAWNYEPALTHLGVPWCGITFPDSGNDDMQVNGEYVVYAIRTMYARAGRRIAIYGHSQGGEVPRWALRFWPDTRAMVDDVVGAAGPNHGSVVADAACGIRKPCQPSDWQAQTTSQFTAALNSYQETFPGISYTEIYSHADEEVQPNQNDSGTSSLHGGGGRITNVAVQDICPNDSSEHLAVGSYDPVTWALLVDALDNDGPASPARVGLSPCTQQFMPGVDPATFPMNSLNAAIAVETSPSQELNGEGPLACYTTASCRKASGPVVSITCVGPGILRFVLHAARGDRVTHLAVYLDGRLVLRRHGRRIRMVRVSVPSAGARLRIVTVSQRGTRRTSTRRITGCRKGAPKTTVTHHASRRPR